MGLRRFLQLFSVLVLLPPAGAHAGEPLPPARLQKFIFEKAEMGVPFRITLFAADAQSAKSAADAAFERVAVLNSIWSDYDPDSELSRLSQSAGQHRAVPVSSEMWRILEASQTIAQRSDGAFDITIGPLVNLWRRARRSGQMPEPELVERMRQRVGFHKLRLEPLAKTAELTEPDMRLDLGGIAKGFAVDEALKVLGSRGIQSALVAASGDMAASDAPPGLKGWLIEVSALDAPDAPPAQIVVLRYSAVSTAGDAFQRLEIHGTRFSHIIDPRTGLGLTDHSLVTVLGPDCRTTDSLETTVNILGPRRGLALIADTPRTAVHIVRQPAGKVEVFDSPNWKALAGTP